jgi:uncharacterized protein with PIN domain
MHGVAWSQKLPVIDGKEIVAMVNEEPITLEELNKAIAAAHSETPQKAKAGRINYANIMQRLINTRLIELEARNMGLDELPEVKSEVDAYAKQLLMELLLERHVKDITVDEEEVTKSYEAIVREWKIKSVRLKKKADALTLESQLKKGRDFDIVVQKAIEWGIAEADQQGQYLQIKDLAVPVAKIVSEMRIGSTSPVLSIGKKGFIIFKLEGSRIPAVENPQAKQQARRQALNDKRVAAAKEYYANLKKRYVKLFDQQLFDTLDYEAVEPGIDKLSTDRRILVKIKGQKPITVGEFTRALNQKFYHGVQRAIQSKRINQKKQYVLEDMLQKRILLKAAFNQDIDTTDAYTSRLREHERSVLFGKFINKVVTPNIKLDLKELKTYYQNNADAFSTPQMIRIKSLIFWKRDDAVTAIDKLKKGTDFSWLASNADGQVDKKTQGLLNFDGRLLTQNGFPEDIQKALANAKPGDFKLYKSSQDHFYVLSINQIIAPEPQPFEAVQKEIAKTVFNEKVKTAIEEWTAQLKKYYPVKIYKADLRQ